MMGAETCPHMTPGDTAQTGTTTAEGTTMIAGRMTTVRLTHSHRKLTPDRKRRRSPSPSYSSHQRPRLRSPSPNRWPDPASLEYLLNFKQFAEWFRHSHPKTAREDDEDLRQIRVGVETGALPESVLIEKHGMAKRYERYRKEYTSRQVCPRADDI